jgi:hypothetical protein
MEALIVLAPRRIDAIERWLRRSGADHGYLPLLMSAPGIGRITGSRSPQGSAISPASPRR